MNCFKNNIDLEKASGSKVVEQEPWTITIRSSEEILNDCGLSNKITTTKYTWYTWLPVSVLEQFRRVANVYFLFMSFLMLIGTYATQLWQSPFNPWGTLLTLIFVLLVTSFKEGYEDLQRSKSDVYENTREVKIVKCDENNELQEIVTETQFIKAGDIIKLEGKMPVPADMLLLLTSNFADGNQCYIETANIDGETNLKLREAPSALMALSSVKKGIPEPALFNGTIDFEPPNKNIHNFAGLLNLENTNPIPLSADHIMLRSALFSNTDWAYGIALYTGQETKIQMNNRKISSKMSKLERYLNRAILMVFVAQCLLVTVSVFSIYILGFNDNSMYPYAFPNGSDSISILPLWLEMFFTFLILYCNFVSITMYVTIEMVNVGQSFFVISDIEMYDETLDVACSVKSSNLVQELGMVSNVFSDKTGTLTRNEMKFVKFIVDGQLYDVPYPDVTTTTPATSKASTTKSTPEESKVKKQQKQDVLSKINDGDRNCLMYRFLLCLTSCHTVVRESDGTYRAESPDELALVQGVEPFDCGIDQRGTTSMTINMLNERVTMDVLAVNAFNSDRKRMSVLLRHKKPDNSYEYIVMCKGADNIMLPLCSIDKQERKSVDKSLLDLACMGLRTLCVAQKILDSKTALSWLEKYNAATNQMHGRAEALSAIGTEIEVDMTLLGITAIEDRLQDEVPEVIADLAKAGIIVWMLTGDKEETAINIGHSCNLLLEKTKLFFLVKIEQEDIYSNQLAAIYEDIQAHTDNGMNKKYITVHGEELEIALVMDGPSFKYFDDQNAFHRKCLLRIGQASRSVIACRLTPVQKQQVVALVKKDSRPRLTCLSIGDGANDVSMIREADVGVGIFGKEGRQAANNADFAIGQFKFLRRLLLIHGRLNYIRQSNVFLYSMHKNMVVVFTLFWYNYYAALSGTSMYNTWIITSYNFCLGLPIIFYGFFDRDISDQFALAHPQVYSTGRDNVYLSLSNIFGWVINAMTYGAVICLIYFIACWETFVTSSYTVYAMGTLIFTGTVLAMQLKIGFLHHQWNWIEITAMVVSILGMFLFFIILSASTAEFNFYYLAMWLYSQGFYWFFGVFSVPIMAFFIDLSFYYCVQFFWPTKEMIYTEMSQNQEEFEKQLLMRRDSGIHRIALPNKTPKHSPAKLKGKGHNGSRSIDDNYDDDNNNNHSDKDREGRTGGQHDTNNNNDDDDDDSSTAARKKNKKSKDKKSKDKKAKRRKSRNSSDDDDIEYGEHKTNNNRDNDDDGEGVQLQAIRNSEKVLLEGEDEE